MAAQIANGAPASACFKTAVICSTEKLLLHGTASWAEGPDCAAKLTLEMN
jgi:hypothetical protein